GGPQAGDESATATHLQLLPQCGPVRMWQEQERGGQEIVQVVGSLEDRHNFGVDTLDRLRVESADGGKIGGQPAAESDGIGATVLRLLIVEERERSGGDDLVRKHRRFGGIATMDADLTAFDTLQEIAHSVD